MSLRKSIKRRKGHRQVRLPLSEHEWEILRTVARTHRKPLGWLLAMAYRAWIQGRVRT